MYRSASRYRERDRSIDRSFGVDGSRLGGGRDTPCFPRRARGPRSCPPHLFLSFRSTFYRHSPRSILSADNASASLRFRGGGVAVLAIDRSSKDRYFRQGVNRYRESRLRSSSSKLMQHLTFRNIFLSCDRASSLSSSPSCLTTVYLFLSPPLIYFSSPLPRWNYRYAGVQLSRVRLCHSCSTERVAGPRRHLAGFTFAASVVAPLRDEKRSSPRVHDCARFLLLSSDSPFPLHFLRISLFFPASWQNIQKHMFRHLERRTMERKAPRIYTPLPFFHLFFLSFPPPPLASPSRTRKPSILSSFVDSSHLSLRLDSSLSPSLFRASSETC